MLVTGLTIFFLIYKKYFITQTSSNKKKSKPQDTIVDDRISMQPLTNSNGSLNKQDNYAINNDEEHKYQEIPDLSRSPSIEKSEYNNYKLQTLNEHLPPPYNKIHMFKNAGQACNSSRKTNIIEGKSTYV